MQTKKQNACNFYQVQNSFAEQSGLHPKHTQFNFTIIVEGKFQLSWCDKNMIHPFIMRNFSFCTCVTLFHNDKVSHLSHLLSVPRR